jgi:hypothetical protein
MVAVAVEQASQQKSWAEECSVEERRLALVVAMGAVAVVEEYQESQ